MPCITHATTIRPPIFAFEIGTWSFANLDVSLQSPLASLSFFFYFFSFISITLKTRRPSCAYHSQVRDRLLLRLLLPLASRLLSHFLSLPLCILSLSLFFSSFFSSFIFIPLFRTRYDPISLHPVHMHQLWNGIPRTLKDNCFPINLRFRLLAIRHRIVRHFC